jgi:sec-independent protein translocase protein TatA
MGAMMWWHWVIVLIAVVILFGSKRLPEVARGLGQSLRIVKSEINEMHMDDSHAAGTPSTAAAIDKEP